MIKEEFNHENYELKGLTEKEADERLKKYGFNELAKAKKKSAFLIFLSQFKDFIVIVLMFATMLSLLLGEVADALTIFIIIIMNGVLGFIQEFRTEKSLEALKELSTPSTLVLRDGKTKTIYAKNLVPGDIVILEAGDSVPADCIIIESFNLKTNESILTGEAVPVEKEAAKSTSAVPNNKNRIFMGTDLTYGKGRALVQKTGMNTEMGKIAHMIQNVKDEDTPLQKRLDKIGKELVFICLIVCVMIVLTGIYHGESIYTMFLSGVSLAVAAIPEGLPAIVTVSLAIGVQRMLKRNALIRKLPAVETLGCTNVICSDKTGTLTENKMTVKKLYVDNMSIDVEGNGYNLNGKYILNNRLYKNEIKNKSPFDLQTPLNKLLLTGYLCNSTDVLTDKSLGDPTEIAIQIASVKGGISKGILSGYTKINEIPFDSERKRMSVLCTDKISGNTYLFVKGAPDKLISLCTRKADKNGISMLSGMEKDYILKVNDDLSSKALRVLCFAYKKITSIPRGTIKPDIESNLIFLGLEGMIDPPRHEVYKAINDCYHAGIKPVMITGDHKNTALAIAKEIGIAKDDSNVLTGSEIDKMSTKELEKRIEDISVYARVTPEHKLKIVRSYKKLNKIVAMTGDGVNDAPALKEADIGVAMGKSGTDVAKEASSMVLLDDNFATIVAAIEEGRIIYDNIRKFIKYLLSCNLGEILMMTVAAFLAMPMPLIPIQILWVNLVTDGLPALALSVDPPDKGIMDLPPRVSTEGIFSRGLGTHIALSGFLIGASALAAFSLVFYLNGSDISKAQTVAFATLIIAELLYSFESRTEEKNIFKKGYFKNIYLVLANIASFALMLMVMYIPFLSNIFKTDILTFYDWLIVLIFSGFEFMVDSFFN